MSAFGNSTGFMLTGHLPLVLSLSGWVALLVSLFLLRLYRRAVLRSMSRRTSIGTTTPSSPTDAVSKRSLRGGARNAEQLRKLASAGPWKTAAIYAFAGAAYAAAMAFAFLFASDTPLLPGRVMVLFWNYFWPATLAVILIAAPTWRRRFAVVAIYLLVLGSGGFYGLDWKQIVLVWAFANLGATLLLALFLIRKIRAAGPMVFAFLLLGFTGCDIALELLAYDVNHSGAFVNAALAVGFSAVALLALTAFAGLIAFSLLGWLAMKWIGRLYEQKKISDQSITLDSIWIVFAVVHGVFLAFNGPLWSLCGLAAFAVYKLALLFSFRVWPLGENASEKSAPRLLLLRVFSLGRRSDRMFGLVARHWRHLGSMHLIAGPDLATATLEPHEFLAFLGGKLSRRFIDGEPALEERLRAMDLGRDFDGRFRVNDFFCHDDTWRMVLLRLIGESDVVLMDLRGFTRSNAGCVFEIEELMKLATPERVLFVIDRGTDERFLEETARAISPQAQLNLFRSSRPASDLRELISALCLAASSGPASTAAA